jgi:sulfur carrier protein ThiS
MNGSCNKYVVNQKLEPCNKKTVVRDLLEDLGLDGKIILAVY